ncbi:MAG: hypothetical protein ACXAC5_00755 [Promethearchaeota archaeon]
MVFIHVKKTGGISLQWLLAKQYGAKFYGGHDHSVLQKIAAVNPIEPDQLYHLPGGSCVCKHWPFLAFQSLQEQANFITIIRDPVSRVVSHYNFYRKHYPKGKAFRDYIREANNINLYTRFMPQDLSVLTEVYAFEDLEQSLSRSQIIQIPDKLPHTNKTPYKYSAKEIDAFKKLNRQDMDLYERLKETFI